MYIIQCTAWISYSQAILRSGGRKWNDMKQGLRPFFWKTRLLCNCYCSISEQYPMFKLEPRPSDMDEQRSRFDLAIQYLSHSRHTLSQVIILRFRVRQSIRTLVHGSSCTQPFERLHYVSAFLITIAKVITVSKRLPAPFLSALLSHHIVPPSPLSRT